MKIIKYENIDLIIKKKKYVKQQKNRILPNPYHVLKDIKKQQFKINVTDFNSLLKGKNI